MKHNHFTNCTDPNHEFHHQITEEKRDGTLLVTNCYKCSSCKYEYCDTYIPDDDIDFDDNPPGHRVR